MKRPPRNPGVRFQRALDREEAAARDMRRAIRRWEKAREELKRAGTKLDTANAELVQDALLEM